MKLFNLIYNYLQTIFDKFNETAKNKNIIDKPLDNSYSIIFEILYFLILKPLF